MQVWDDIINQASKNVDVLKDQEAVKQLGSILKTNVRACKALGHPFVSQLGRIYLDMLNVYKVIFENMAVLKSFPIISGLCKNYEITKACNWKMPKKCISILGDV